MIIGQAGAGVYIDDLTHRVHRPDSSGDTVGAFMIGEQIVRCRDCKHCVADPEPIDPGWPLMCDDTGRDMLEPYGFCAWGERRAMTSATEDLRALLDERGVEWRDSSDENVIHTTWNDMSCWFNEFPDGWTAWGMAKRGTPEQAIEATLGPGICEVEEYEDTGIPVCSECGAVQPEDHTVYFCWCCGRKVIKHGG